MPTMETTCSDSMSETTEENHETPCIGVLRDKGTFFVPFYQRGYRWEEPQVKQLLKDIEENTEGERKYSLQPIVVAKKGMNEVKQRWELIDGQQRLTTLNLILLALGEEQILIEYARHQDETDEPISKSGLEINKYLRNAITCQEDWNEIKQNESHLDTVDNHHIVNAWLTIKTWLGDPIPSDHFMKSAILCRTSVIWHEVASENGASEFLRFNTGKIHLSPCELLKARFLATHNPPMKHRSPEEIAAEWDQMESAFHEGEFWSYLHPSKNVSEAPNRIALLFELLIPSKEDDLAGRCYLYKFAEPNQVPEIEAKWLELRRCFLTLQEWYSNREIRHQIGFLRWSRTGKSVELEDLWKEFQKGRSAFRTQLAEKIKDTLEPPNNPNKWQDADFREPNDRHYLQDLLLWFNIATLPPDTDYPFARHATVTTWSLEHIHAQNSPDAANREQFTEWKNESMKILEHLKKKSADKQNKVQSVDAEKIEELKKEELKIEKLFGRIQGLALEESADSLKIKEITEQAKLLAGELGTLLPISIGDMDKVWNLALLDRNENSALLNGFFHQKRRKILDFDQSTEHFVPPATVRVFLKGYTSEPEDLILWGPKDRETYKKRIGEVLEFTTKKGTPNHV
jgi:hypothetical protein